MFIIKTLQTTITLYGNDIYTADLTGTLIRELTKRYKNVCYQSMLILSIIRIKETPSVIMNTNTLDGSAYADVQFEVYGVVYSAGEILHNCRVLEFNQSSIIMEHEHAGILLQKHSDIDGVIFKILKANQRIPVIVHNASYAPGKNSISMIAYPYAPSVDTVVYWNIKSGLTPEQTDKLSIILTNIEEEEKNHKAIATVPSYAFFRDLLYPYKINQKFDQSAKASALKLKPVQLNLKSLLEINAGCVTYPPEDNRMNKRLFLSTDFKADLILDTDIYIDSDAYTAISEICKKYLMHLQALRGFMETYPTEKAASELVTYFNLCKRAQL